MPLGGGNRMVTIPDTQQLMDGGLGQFLLDQRGARAEAKAKSRSRMIMVALIGVPLALAILILVPFDFGVKMWIILFVGAIVAGWSYAPIKHAKKQVKIGINEGIAAALGMTYRHDGEAGREFNNAKRFRLVPSHDRASLEDFWSGEIDGYTFLLHEAHLQERRGSGKNRRMVTVFRGAIIRIASGRRFHGTTLVKRPGQHDSWFGLGGRKHSVDFDGHRLDAVDMVHPDFNDRFEVWSDDQVEARYLVDPLYIERLLEMESAFGGDNICSLFSEGDIIVAVRGGNMFESGTMNPDRDREMVEHCCSQLASMGRLAQQVQKDLGFVEER